MDQVSNLFIRLASCHWKKKMMFLLWSALEQQCFGRLFTCIWNAGRVIVWRNEKGSEKMQSALEQRHFGSTGRSFETCWISDVHLWHLERWNAAFSYTHTTPHRLFTCKSKSETSSFQSYFKKAIEFWFFIEWIRQPASALSPLYLVKSRQQTAKPSAEDWGRGLTWNVSATIRERGFCTAVIIRYKCPVWSVRHFD